MLALDNELGPHGLMALLHHEPSTHMAAAISNALFTGEPYAVVLSS